MNLTVFLGRMFVQSDVTLGSVAVSGGDENPGGHATEVAGVLRQQLIGFVCCRRCLV